MSPRAGSCMPPTHMLSTAPLQYVCMRRRRMCSAPASAVPGVLMAQAARGACRLCFFFCLVVVLLWRAALRATSLYCITLPSHNKMAGRAALAPAALLLAWTTCTADTTCQYDPLRGTKAADNKTSCEVLHHGAGASLGQLRHQRLAPSRRARSAVARPALRHGRGWAQVFLFGCSRMCVTCP